MTGHIETTTAGSEIFIPWSCPYCTMDTAGNHSFGCPNREHKRYDPYTKSFAYSKIVGYVKKVPLNDT